LPLDDAIATRHVYLPSLLYLCHYASLADDFISCRRATHISQAAADDGHCTHATPQLPIDYAMRLFSLRAERKKKNFI